MANLKTDSPISRRIVLSFLDFLKSVEPSPGVDVEGLEVVKECLHEVFQLTPSSIDDQRKPDLLVEYFSSLDANKQHESCPSHATYPVAGPSSSLSQDAAEASVSQLPKQQDEHLVEEPYTLGVSKDELFGHFFGALDKIDFFKRTADGGEDHTQIDKATHLFHEAVLELERSGIHTIDSRNLAETFKSQGNREMQSKLYSDAIELYTYAIALCGKNAVYFCNRAAAYTQMEKYMEAIEDCYKSIDIDPNYSKAYSRLGLAYYAQGNYLDAIEKGFMKALQLDPNNNSIRENIQVAVQKLTDPHSAERHQNGGSTRQNNHEPNNQSAGASSNHSSTSSFTSMPFNPASLSSDVANMFMNMYQGQHSQERPYDGRDTGRYNMPLDPAAFPPEFTNMFMNMSHGQHPPERPHDGSDTGPASFPPDFANMFTNTRQDEHSQERPREGRGAGWPDEPEIRVGGNISLNFGDDVPEELMGTWRSVMGMFSGAQPHQNPQGDNH